MFCGIKQYHGDFKDVSKSSERSASLRVRPSLSLSLLLMLSRTKLDLNNNKKSFTFYKLSYSHRSQITDHHRERERLNIMLKSVGIFCRKLPIGEAIDHKTKESFYPSH